MAEKNRTDLKTYFQIGKRPTQEQFADLIDSVLNKLDDGISVNENNIGIGTDNPSTRLEVVTQDSWNVPPFRIGSDDSNEPAVDFKSGTDSFSIAVNNGTTDAFKIDHSAIENSLVIRDSGNVGVGTDNPEAKLEIAVEPEPGSGETIFRTTIGDAPDDYFSIQNTTGADNQFIPTLKGYHASDNEAALFLLGEIPPEQDNGDKAIIRFNARQPGGPITTRPIFQWGNYTDTKMTMDVDGNVGIGTTNPQGKLDIAGPIRYSGPYTGTILFGNTGETGTPTGDGFRIRYHDSFFGPAMDALIVEKTDSNHTPPDGGITFVNTGNNGVEEPAMTIRGNGNVGIGTNNPDEKLHVEGNIYLEDYQLRFRGASNGYNRIFSQGGISPGSWTFKSSFDNLILDAGENISNPRDILFSIGGEEKVRVNTSGNVGIGTSNPGSDKLDVRGRSYSSEGWHNSNADYAEYFESENAKAIPIGTAVTIGEHGKIRPVKKGETPIGIVSAIPGVVGNSPREWPGKYLRDAFGQVIMEEYEEDEYIPKAQKTAQKNPDGTPGESKEEVIPATDGQPVLVKSGKKLKKQRKKRNPEYDESKPYVLREDREEWCCIGLLGQLPLRKGQTVAPTWVKLRELSDQADLWLVK